MRKALISVIAMAVLAASGYAQSGIGGVRWDLTEMNGKRMANSRAFIEFDESASRLSGNAGCNRMFGGYELAGQRFRARQIGTTKMACLGRGVARAEAEFLNALRKADRLRRNGNTLTIRAAGEGVLRFQRARRSDREPVTMDLTARKWMLRSIDGRPVNLARDAPFLNFDDAKGSAGGNSGCNVFGGEYEAVGSSIKFSNIMSTMRACEYENRMTVERRFLDALQAADRFRIEGNNLVILKGANMLLEFEGTAK